MTITHSIPKKSPLWCWHTRTPCANCAWLTAKTWQRSLWPKDYRVGQIRRAQSGSPACCRSEGTEVALSWRPRHFHVSHTGGLTRYAHGTCVSPCGECWNPVSLPPPVRYAADSPWLSPRGVARRPGQRGATLALITATPNRLYWFDTMESRNEPREEWNMVYTKAAKISGLFLRFYFAQAAAGAAVGFVAPIAHALLRP